MYWTEQPSSHKSRIPQIRTPPSSSRRLSISDAASSRLPRQVNTTGPIRIIGSTFPKRLILNPHPFIRQSSRYSSSSTSSRTLGRKVQSGQSINSITQLYYKFKNQPPQIPVCPARPNSSLSNVLGLLSSYSNQTNLAAQAYCLSQVTHPGSEVVDQYFPSDAVSRSTAVSSSYARPESHHPVLTHRVSSNSLMSSNLNGRPLPNPALTRCASFQSSLPWDSTTGQFYVTWQVNDHGLRKNVRRKFAR